MTPDILLVLGIVAGALALFIWNRLRADIVGLIVMVALLVTGLVTPREGISGFANEATITVAAMFVLSAGLLRTGGIDVLGAWIERLSGRSETRLLVVMMLVVMVASAFINNTPVVVVMVPAVLGVARKLSISPSRVFMPLSFASQLGGTLTLIGTSTNLLVAGLLVELGYPRLGLFQFTLPALVLALLGMAYLLTIGRWLTPAREPKSDLLASYELRDYLSAIVVDIDSPLAGKSLADARFATTYGVQVVGIHRGDTEIASPGPSTVLQGGDVLLVRGNTSDLTTIIAEAHVTVTEPMRFGEAAASLDSTLAEMIVLPRSSVVGSSLRQAQFRTRHGVAVLGIQRHGEPLRQHLADITFLAGDVLLVQGSNEQLMSLHDTSALAMLGAVEIPAKRRRKLPTATMIMLGTILLAAFDVVPILVAALLGVVAMFLTRCLTPEEAYAEVDWMVLVLLGSLIPLGIAMQKTGAAAYVAGSFLVFAAPLGPYGVLFAVYLLTSLLTELISNNAAALVITPIVIAAATAMGISPMPLIIGAMFAASNSFMTPIGYQTNTFIYGPGGYRFSDFIRVGGLLSVLLAIAATLVIPEFFPF